MYRYVSLGAPVVEPLSGTAGTICLTCCKQVNLQACLDVNSGHEIALRQSNSAAATVSKASAEQVITDLGVAQFRFTGLNGSVKKYLAYKAYNGASVASATSSSDKLIAERLG